MKNEIEGPIRVLCVEDDPLLLDTYKSVLSDRFEVRCFSDSNSIQVQEFEWCEVLLADFAMPSKTGLELMEEMYSYGFERPVLFVTGRVPELLEGLRSFHLVEVLEKPTDLESLSELISIYGVFSRSLQTLQEKLFLRDLSHSEDCKKAFSQYNSFKFSKIFNLRQKLVQKRKAS